MKCRERGGEGHFKESRMSRGLEGVARTCAASSSITESKNIQPGSMGKEVAQGQIDEGGAQRH